MLADPCGDHPGGLLVTGGQGGGPGPLSPLLLLIHLDLDLDLGLFRCVRGGLLFSSSTHLQPPFLLPLPLPRPASPPPAAPARPWPPPPPPPPSRRPPPSPPISPSPSPVPRAIRLPPTARCSVLRCSTPHGVLARSTDPPGALSTGGEGTSSPSLPAASLPKPPRRAAARRYRWIY